MLTFIIRHLQETAIAALILTAAAAILTDSAWAAVIGGALTLELYAWLGGRYAYLNARQAEIDALRPSLAASPSDFDREYVTEHVRPGDLIEPRNSGTSADKKTAVVTLFHGHYRPIARLIVSSDDPLPGALSKGAFFGRVKSVPDGNTGEFRIEIQAKSPKDDRLI